MLARRSVLAQLKGFNRDLRFGEDLELWLRIAAQHQIACVQQVCAVRVTHGTNSTKSIEPMLRGYVDLAEVIRGWAKHLMPSWGLNANRLVATSLADLGYWYFSQNRLREARRVFAQSLGEQLTRKALVYGLASTLPTGMLNLIRRSKTALARS